MFDTMKVAREIREARIAKNMTQMNLADEMGVSYQAVSNWERGGSMPDIGKLEELCRILELSLDQLLGAKSQVENIQKVMDYANGKTEESPSLEGTDGLPRPVSIAFGMRNPAPGSLWNRSCERCRKSLTAWSTA